jgi:hypothetical protein
VPATVPPPCGATVAVNVTFWPQLDGFEEVVRVVVVAFRLDELNVAVALATPFTVTWQVVPVAQPSLQLVNDDFVPGVSVNVTTVPGVNCALHVPGQLMPAGLLVTVP